MKYTHNYLTALAILMLITVASCKKTKEFETLTTKPMYEYYPMKVGKFIQYKGDSIYYNDVTGVVVRDTVKFDLREEFEAVYAGPDSIFGDYRIYVKIRYLGDSTWINQHTWYAQLDKNYLTKTEENLRFLKLNFPLKLGKTWNGNVYITEPDIDDPNQDNLDLNQFYDDWEYKIETINIPETINTLPFDSVMKVVEIEDSNKLEFKNVYSKYAANVGLVERKFEYLLTQQTAPSVLPFWRRAENGFTTTIKITSYN